MTDLFAAYAMQAIPQRVQREQARAEKAPSALDQKMAEKQRLNKAYRAWQRGERAAVLAAEPRLRDFLRYLRKTKPEDGDELIDAIRFSWLPRSAQAVRIFALRLIARHSDRLNRANGMKALDDPLPPETSVYFVAREILHAGGRA